MRTPHLVTFCSSISAINNHFSHASFVFEQFRLNNTDKVKKYPSKLTAEVYSENTLSAQFNVRLAKIELQAKESMNFITDSLFVFANTHFEVYLKDLFIFFKDVTGIQLGELPDKAIFENVLKALSIDPDTDLDNLTLSTFEYFKLRRNAIMHRDRKKYFQTSFNDLIKGTFGKSKNNHTFRKKQLNGTQLNVEWKKHRENAGKGYTVNSINFTNNKEPDFSFDELCDVLNFYRLFAAEIDKLVLSRIDRVKIISYCQRQYRTFYKGKEDEKLDEKFFIRFKRTCIFELGFEPTEVDIEKIVKGI